MAAVRSGSTCRVVAERFGVAGRTVGHRKPILAPHHDRLMARVQECSEVTLFALRDDLRAKGGAGLAGYGLALRDMTNGLPVLDFLQSDSD